MLDFNLSIFQLMILPVTGIQEFDVMFSLVFEMGLIFFLLAEPLRMFMGRTK